MEMFKRRSIGPAYERSPLEKLTDWGYRNMLFLFSVSVGIVFWMLLMNWTFDSFLPGIQGEGSGAQEIQESSNGPIAVVIKLVGSLLIVWFFNKQSHKR